MDEPKIHENSNESEILVSSEEHISDLSSGDAFAKRAKLNGGTLSSSDKEGHTQFQQILGLQEELYDENE